MQTIYQRKDKNVLQDYCCPSNDPSLDGPSLLSFDCFPAEFFKQKARLNSMLAMTSNTGDTCQALLRTLLPCSTLVIELPQLNKYQPAMELLACPSLLKVLSPL